MADSHLVSGLKTLRAEKLGDLQRLQEEIALLEADATRIETVIMHVDGVLKEVAPHEDITAIQPVRTRRKAETESYSGRDNRSKANGPQVPQHVLRVLREEGIPLTIAEIVELAMRLRPDDNRSRVANCVRGYLKLKVDEGLLQREEGRDGEFRYSIKH